MFKIFKKIVELKNLPKKIEMIEETCKKLVETLENISQDIDTLKKQNKEFDLLLDEFDEKFNNDSYITERDVEIMLEDYVAEEDFKSEISNIEDRLDETIDREDLFEVFEQLNLNEDVLSKIKEKIIIE
jgi:chromosome segregation ATPase